jgi:DNA-binding beta-propeller fold protein YncE
MKKIDLLKSLFCCLILAAGFTACEEEDPAVPDKHVPGAHGVFILNEGNYGGNNAGLSYYNFETENLTSDILDGKLGDTGQDIIAYGSKLYISVNQSGYIRVVDIHSQASLASIELKEDGKTLEPRYLTSYGGKIYVTSSNLEKGNVIRIDTTTLKVEALTKVGDWPEGIAAVNGKLYVANGGHGAGNTVSIVDIAQFKEEKTIEVGVNPYIIHADQYGDLYLSYQGNFYDDLGGLQRIDKTNTVTNLNIPANKNFTIVDDLLYFFGGTYNPDYSVNNTFGVFNVKTETLTSNPIISDGTPITVAYGIGVNPQTNEVYISDSDSYTDPGTIYVFGIDGKKKDSFKAGISANNFIFY